MNAFGVKVCMSAEESEKSREGHGLIMIDPLKKEHCENHMEVETVEKCGTCGGCGTKRIRNGFQTLGAFED